jgi:hypothetical protein
MTDHAGLLRQIRQDARPYIEQALDLAEVFTGFRKLASENGLDWGVIKALIKAEVQDEKEGGSGKVDRIIEKADFASAYADMLGLGSNMNEKIFSSETHRGPTKGEPSSEAASQGEASHAGTGSETLASLGANMEGEAENGSSDAVSASPLPPHDPSTGELIEELGPEAAAVRSGLGEASPASGDVVEINASPGAAPCDASPNDSDPASDGPANSEDEAVPAVPVSSSPLSGDDPGEMPTFLKRGDPECIVRAA